MSRVHYAHTTGEGRNGDAWASSQGRSGTSKSFNFRLAGDHHQPAPPASPRPPSGRPKPHTPRRGMPHASSPSTNSPSQHRRVVEPPRPASVANGNIADQHASGAGHYPAERNVPAVTAAAAKGDGGRSGSSSRPRPSSAVHRPTTPRGSAARTSKNAAPPAKHTASPTTGARYASPHGGSASTPHSTHGTPTSASPRGPFPFNYIRAYGPMVHLTTHANSTSRGSASPSQAYSRLSNRNQSPSSGTYASPHTYRSSSTPRQGTHAGHHHVAGSGARAAADARGAAPSSREAEYQRGDEAAYKAQHMPGSSPPPSVRVSGGGQMAVVRPSARTASSPMNGVIVPRIGIPSPSGQSTPAQNTARSSQPQHTSRQQEAQRQQQAAAAQQAEDEGADPYGGGMGAHSPYEGVGVVSPRVVPPSQENGWLRGYTLGRLLGEGGFCKVRLGVHTLTGSNVAVKMIDKSKLVEPNDRRRVGREIRVLKRLMCAGIIKLYEVVDAPGHIYVVMEYADGGSLLDYVRSRKRLDECEARHFFYQILQALVYCHQAMVVHRDVKLENILLDRQRNMKLIDFGLSAFLNPGKKLRVHCGSPSYAAPEIIARKLYDGPPVDVWSLGVVLFAMVSGYLPFHAGNNKQELCQKIVRGVYTAPDFISPDSADLIRRMLTVDPEKRITTEEILQHRWVRSGPQCRPIWYLNLNPSGVQLDEDVLSTLEGLGVARPLVLEAICHNQHNYISTSYFLLLSAKRDHLASVPGTAEADFAHCPCLRVVPPCSNWLQTVMQTAAMDDNNPYSLNLVEYVNSHKQARSPSTPKSPLGNNVQAFKQITNQTGNQHSAVQSPRSPRHDQARASMSPARALVTAKEGQTPRGGKQPDSSAQGQGAGAAGGGPRGLAAPRLRSGVEASSRCRDQHALIWCCVGRAAGAVAHSSCLECLIVHSKGGDPWTITSRRPWT